MVKRAASSASSTSYDGKALHPAAVKLPQITKKSASESQNKVLARQYACLQRIVDQCYKEPKTILPLHAELLSLQVDEEAPCSDQWTGQYDTVGGLPEPWKVGFILARAQKMQLPTINKELLGKMAEEDKENIPNLFGLISQLPLAMTLPQECGDQEVCSSAFHKRCDEFGDILSEVVKRGGILPSGKLDLKRAGVFSSTMVEGACTELKCITGDTCRPNMSFDAGFRMQDNVFLHKARVVKNSQDLYIYKFFDESCNFRGLMYKPSSTAKHFNKLCCDVKGEIAKREHDIAAGVVKSSAEIVEKAAAKAARANLEKAKEGLAKRKAERQVKRTVSM